MKKLRVSKTMTGGEYSKKTEIKYEFSHYELPAGTRIVPGILKNQTSRFHQGWNFHYNGWNVSNCCSLYFN